MDHVYADEIIRFKAQQLARRKGCSKTDREDIAQELWLQLQRNFGRFDPGRASEHTYIVRIVESKAASIARHQKAAKRDPEREEASLQEIVRDGDGRLVHRSESTKELGHDPWPHFDLAHDLLTAVGEMPADLQEAFHRARQGEPLPKLSRLTMKQYLEDRGLEVYLT